jgi:N-acetylmuramoyl-L-alanine amidase
MLLAVSAANAQTPRDRYEEAVAREAAVRRSLDAAETGDTESAVLQEARRVAVAYEAIVRRFPTSGYADNALWQAAALAQAAYEKFAREVDRDRAVKLYQWLAGEYPHSRMVEKAKAMAAKLQEPPKPLPAAAPARQTPAAAASPAGRPEADAPTVLRAIQRTVLPDVVRITLELEHEVSYAEQRIDGPPRLFFDLRNVQAAPDLVDSVLSYDGDVVSKIRLGRHPDNTVRVVIDLQDVARHSVFTLYNPFRLVIDFVRATSRTSTSLPAPPASGPEPSGPRTEGPTPAAPAPPATNTPATAAAAAPVPSKPPAPAPSPAPPAANTAGGFSIARQLGLSVARIVIDPGHGGHDPGAQVKGLDEADLVLDVALRLEKVLQDEPGLEVTLTRRTNVYVPLEERTAIANRQNADLFLSIHANASRNTAARGIETYFLNFASSPDAEAVAARENAASERTMHQLPDIIRAIALNNKLDESRDLAAMVQESLVTRLRRTNKDVRNLGVKKAPFVVLIGAEMPSVLAEIGFITNKSDVQLVKSATYRQRIAEALETAVLKYRRSLKGTTTVAAQTPQAP